MGGIELIERDYEIMGIGWRGTAPVTSTARSSGKRPTSDSTCLVAKVYCNVIYRARTRAGTVQVEGVIIPVPNGCRKRLPSRPERFFSKLSIL